MNYAAFERMQTGALSRLENEPEQDYMTRVFREICRCDGFCGPDTPCSEHRINDMTRTDPDRLQCGGADTGSVVPCARLDVQSQGNAPRRDDGDDDGYDDGNAHALLPEDKCGLYSQLVP